MADFDRLYDDEFQCPYCTSPFKFSRNRERATQEAIFRVSRRELVRKHVETYHPDKMQEFPN